MRALKKDRLLLAGLWTETEVTFAALSGHELGYQICVVTDATAVPSHDVAMDRMVQSGVVPITWRQVLSEWYWALDDKDSGAGETLIEIAREHGLVLAQSSSGND